MNRNLMTAALAAAALLAAATPADATLGEPLTSVASTRQALRAVSIKTAQRAGYRMNESTLASGTVVREYTDASGLVFAVSWQGPFQPNLKVLLGSYFPRLAAAGRQPHPDHRRLVVREPQLVIESGGRQRAFRGLAYLPDKTPAGFSFQEDAQ